MDICNKDKDILRELAEKQAQIAELPIHKQKIRDWKRLNANKPGRSLVWINEVPWHEMDINDELKIQTTNPFCQQVEQTLRRTIYEWNHFPVDMIVEGKFYSPLVIHDTGFGIAEDVDIAETDQKNDVVSRGFHSQINCEKDIEKIKDPIITHDSAGSEQNYQILKDIFGDILNIKKRGIVHQWFSPWDELIRWWDVQKALTDLVLRPELIHQAMDRLTNAYLSRLKQWKELNLLSLTDGNYRVGSGGLGYTDDLPHKDFNPDCVRTIDQWGCGTAQIFSTVSPKMHEEFALQYERRWMEQFGLNYYGCCEPLDNKIDILKSIPNLRKISMSPWAKIEKMVEKTNGNYVLSYKPNPSIFASEDWNIKEIKTGLREVLNKTQGCTLEIIMKDISTVQYRPQRLWEWAKAVMEVTSESDL
jgi:hypothetical protein